MASPLCIHSLNTKYRSSTKTINKTMKTHHQFTYTPAAIGRGLNLFAKGLPFGCVLLKNGDLDEGFVSFCFGIDIIPWVASVFGVTLEEAGPLFVCMARAALEDAIAKGVI